MLTYVQLVHQMDFYILSCRAITKAADPQLVLLLRLISYQAQNSAFFFAKLHMVPPSPLMQFFMVLPS